MSSSRNIVIWIYNTLDNNFEIRNDFTKYLMGTPMLVLNDPANEYQHDGV